MIQRFYLLQSSVAGFAARLCLKRGLCIGTGVQPDGCVVLEVGNPSRVRVLPDGAALFVCGIASRTVPHRLQAWVVHRHRFAAAAAATARHHRCVLHLPHNIHWKHSYTRNLAIANKKSHKVTEITFKCHSRSSEISRFNRAHAISYYRSIAITALSCIVSHI